MMNGRIGSKLDADVLTPAEIELLTKRCSRRAPTGVRDRALVAVLWHCGLRIGEALALAQAFRA
jgi:integrase